MCCLRETKNFEWLLAEVAADEKEKWAFALVYGLEKANNLSQANT